MWTVGTEMPWTVERTNTESVKEKKDRGEGLLRVSPFSVRVGEIFSGRGLASSSR